MNAHAPTLVTPAAPQRRRRKRSGLLLGLALLALAAVLLAAAGLGRLDAFGSAPVHVIVDGQEVWSGTGWGPSSPLLLAGGAAALVGLGLLLVVALPLLVLGLFGLVLLAVVLAVLCSVGLPLLIVGGVLAVLLAVLLTPVVLALLLLGWLF